MRGPAKTLSLAVLLGFSAIRASAVVVRVDNPAGNITARVVTGKDVQVRHSSPKRKIRESDTRVTRRLGQGLILVECRPEDAVPINLEIDLPYGVELEAKTKSGSILIHGMIARAEISTDTGGITLRVPLSATRLAIDADQAPQSHSLPQDASLSIPKVVSDGRNQRWQLRDRLSLDRVTYGSIDVKARSPERIVLADTPIPENSPVKLPWQAPEVLDAILGITPQKNAETTAANSVGPPPALVEGSEVRFSSDVRMVNLMVAVSDRDGEPLTGLREQEFEVLEDGVAQKIAAVSSEQVPFNLVLLLDWSGSTERDRGAMRKAARSFVEVARSQDRVAVYALVGNMVMVASPLTDDRKQLLEEIGKIPDTPGGTPLYDAIVLAYAQELRQRPGERNALLVISDGADNQIRPTSFVFDNRVGAAASSGLPSEVSFVKLTRAAAEMNALIYPILLDPTGGSGRPLKDWAELARDRMRELAKVSGGRLFSAKSVRDLDPVYARVANELRSVYGVAYYPKNQKFDGEWRRIEVNAVVPRAVVRTRTGYSAR